MKWLIGLVGLAMVLVAAPVQAAPPSQDKAEVMTQNLYIGADLSRLLAGEPPAAILGTILQTNYPERAVEVAAAINERDPDLVGLQEVWDISLFDSQGNTLLEIDYLDILMFHLAAQGGSYAVASTVTNADVTLPVDPVAGTFARVIDRDVIIYRTDTTTVSNAHSANFATNFTVPFGDVLLEFTRGYTAVDANVDGVDLRFVNTHLEVEDAPCVTVSGLVECQDVQAEELRDALANETLPVILVGDFNAEPGSTAYSTIDDASYYDTWMSAGPQPGYTCCQAEDLLNPHSQLTQRIDHIFVSDDLTTGLIVNAKVLGDSNEEKTPSGLWYSDHGGVWAKLHLG